MSRDLDREAHLLVKDVVREHGIDDARAVIMAAAVDGKLKDRALALAVFASANLLE